ncbi:hypothetical protein YDYSG_53490 [Paenibacillus tyrfis]|uniref:hypothetical protein n=1 Tax=Paenibacillus tyrfis TaxID=1501230 RepID=UPI002493A13B|nr:hypothetical protein [Paenibacillus tyrfis]GLI09317.1 hypothetical protein YDYSG_53490 [Paenibacillus tyrfis]
MQFIKETESLMHRAGVHWNPKQKIFVADIHRELVLKEEEVSKEEDIKVFCELVMFLRSHLEYGVSTAWHESKLNRYVYLMNKKQLEDKFSPLIINTLDRYYKETDILKLYKSLGADDPNIIDLVGTTAAGKTTFCKQLVDDLSKKLLELTISMGNSTVIQTDILVLKKTKRKLIMSIRAKEEILTDMILVALKGDEKRLDDLKRFKKSCGENINLQLDEDTVNDVLDLFDRDDLLDIFREFVFKVKANIKAIETNSPEFDYFKCAREMAQQPELGIELDEVIKMEFLGDLNADLGNVYGYRYTFTLPTDETGLQDAENFIIKTIAKKEFLNRKEDYESYPELKNMVSTRIIFKSAIFVLPPDDGASKIINFGNGVVLRDSQGHKTTEQYTIASDFSVKSKIMLIPVSTGGVLIDDEKRDLLQKIAISEPKNTVFIITKIDKTDEYSKFMDEEKDEQRFLKSLKVKIKDTHKNMLESWNTKKKEIIAGSIDSEYELNDKQAFNFFIETFNSAFLTSIKGKNKLAYKIQCDVSPDGSILDKDNVKINKISSWYGIVAGLIENKKGTIYKNIDRSYVKRISSDFLDVAQSDLVSKAESIINFYINNEKWEERVTEALSWYDSDFRIWRPEGEAWYFGSFRNEKIISNISGVFKDPISVLLNIVNRYTIKDKEFNAVNYLLVENLASQLRKYYQCDDENFFRETSRQIITECLETSLKISYKAYDRNLYKQSWYTNLKPVMEDNLQTERYITGKAPSWLKDRQRWYGYVNTETGQRLAMYCNLLSTLKANLQSNFELAFFTVLTDELRKLDSKIL